MPDHEAERADPDDAEAQYEDAVSVLRELTRDRDRFPLVFKENINYGWRRNSFALRPFAVPIALLALVVSASVIVFGDGTLSGSGARWTPAISASVLGLAWWGLVVSETWVRSAAELYADRLFEATHTLALAAAPI